MYKMYVGPTLKMLVVLIFVKELANHVKIWQCYWEPDKTSRDKTSHAIFLHPGQNIPQRFATPDKTSHAVFVTPDITSHAIFVTPDITSHAIFATPDKTSHTQTASSG